MWQEEVVSIGKIQSLLDSGYEVEIDSPDGWVGVNFFIEKGEWQEYRLLTDNGFEVRCNEDHLFKTAVGWLSAKEIVAVQDRNQQVHFATKNGLSKGLIEQTGKIVDIVDINVNHENHRYYTNNVESHNTGVGKSLFMCHVAASCLTQNYNVLYITLEMSEEKIAERIDANLLNVTLDDLMNMPKDMYERRMQKLQEKVKGKLIIKEYPTASANPAHFRALINDLALKKNFRPDIIFIDYLNICASARIKAGANVNSYTYIKAIAEELRGLAVENNVPIVSATQTTRSGFSNSDPGLEDTSESFGLPATADFMFALVSNEELQQLNQMLVKQLKNRYNDPNLHKRFTIGVDRAKMKLYDLEQKAQDAVMQEPEPSKPVFDRGKSKDKFKNLKV
jgi:hypothetical protein